MFLQVRGNPFDGLGGEFTVFAGPNAFVFPLMKLLHGLLIPPIFLLQISVGILYNVDLLILWSYKRRR